MLNIVNSCIGTKYTSRFGPLMAQLALDAVRCVAVDRGDGTKEIDLKKYAKVEKIPGGAVEDCRVLAGVMFAKDVVAPARMRRRIERPRVVLLDCPMEYKKGENATNVEITNEKDFTELLKIEEQWIEEQCAHVLRVRPDVVITEKGLSDLAAYHLAKAGVSAIRRIRKTDNNRVARATGATVVNRPEERKEEDVGTKAGLFEVKQLGDEYFTFLVDCKEPKACTIILRGASKDVLNEVERNLTDAMGVARNVVHDPRLVPGGGAVEMAVSRALAEKATAVAGVEQWPYRAVGSALEVIPRTLAQNCGANVIRTLTKLRAKHAEAGDGGVTFGINGHSGEIVDMKALGVWEPLAVKVQTIKTAVESAALLLRIDDIVSGLKKGGGKTGGPKGPEIMNEDGGDDGGGEK
jgi:T-complex protein 1 subunit gamma